MQNQENFWSNEFGDEYHERNKNLVENNFSLFNKVFCEVSHEEIKSVLEFGSGIGDNLTALSMILGDIIFDAIEINKKACMELYENIYIRNVYNISINEFISDAKYDLVLCKGILIHTPPDEIDGFYDKMYHACNKYILMCEYFNPIPMEVKYRGNDDKLWKRDFCGELLDKYTDLRLLKYGFVYKRDKYPQDNLTWWLLEKR